VGEALVRLDQLHRRQVVINSIDVNIICCCPYRQRFIDKELNKRLGRPAEDPLEGLTEGERVRLQQEQELFAVPEDLKVCCRLEQPCAELMMCT
jgi:hypothetical protein